MFAQPERGHACLITGVSVTTCRVKPDAAVA